MNLLIAVLCIFFFGAVLLLVILNDATVDVNLFFRSYREVPLSVVMVSSLLVGIVFTALISIFDGVRIRIQNHRLRRELVRRDKDLEPRPEAPPSGEPAQEQEDPAPPSDFPHH